MSSIFVKRIIVDSLKRWRVVFTHIKRDLTTKLMEVGHLETPKVKENYIPGQLFLHKLFGYRGLVMIPWSARMYDRDKLKQAGEDALLNKSNSKDTITKGNTEKTHSTFYNVLIDSRDHPYARVHTSAVTYLRYTVDHSRNLSTIPGLDYASHEDILPYTPTHTQEERPFQHELTEQFFVARTSENPPFTPRDTLLQWQRNNRMWLEVGEVHRETTEKIRVTVAPFFIGHHESLTADEFWWRYWICLENLGDQAVRLRERNWKIFSDSGARETVQGRGVLGQEPVLSPSQPAFQYSSHVSLQAPLGHMWGKLRMEREDGVVFDCKIPRFCLKIRDFQDSD